MDIVTALALSIGLLGGVATYLYLSDPLVLGLQIWAAFIAWASFYHCGGKIQGFISSILANLWGVVMATSRCWRFRVSGLPSSWVCRCGPAFALPSASPS